MLTPEAILTLLQAFLNSRNKSNFPIPFISNAAFGNARPTELAGQEEWDLALADLHEFLCLPLEQMENGLAMGDYADDLCSRWQLSRKEICFSTSGTLGQPKKCVHDIDMLSEEGEFLQTLLGTSQRIVSAAPPQHCYGFMFGLFLPMIAKIPVKRTLPFAKNLYTETRNGETGIGFPFMYESSQPLNTDLDVRFISATSPLNTEAFRAMLKAGYKIIEIFGSSETGVLGWRKYPDEPFTIAPYYKKQDDIAVFRKSRKTYVKLMDKIEWVTDDSFYSHGRRDKIIQICGVNVSLENIVSKMQNITGIKECSVRQIASDVKGRVKAFVVPEDNSDIDVLEEKIRKELRKFPAEERPVRITFGLSLPRNAMGKLRDWD